MRQDILCGGIVRVSSVCMHSNEPFIMGCVVCVRCVPPVDTTAHRVDKAPHPARRRAAEVRSSVPRLAAYSGVGSGQGAVDARGPRAGPRRRPRDARDRPRRARSRAVRGSCIIEFSTARTRGPRGPRPDPKPGPEALAVLAPRFLARSNEVSCRHQKSTSQFQIRMRRRLRATDNTRCDGRATVAGVGPARGREARPVRVRPGTCYIQLHRL
jgi:hypothetical protein